MSPSDREIVEQLGIGVIDCSWAEVERLQLHRLKAGHPRLRTSIAGGSISHRRLHEA